ncbi:MAG: gluconokinase [Bacteroidota bacterium]
MSPIIIVMGVSGSGKSTIGTQLSQKTGIPFFDADDYHPQSNVDKMGSGQALTDIDRWPWLQRLATLLAAAENDQGAILACSALKDSYRQLLEGPLTTPPSWIYLDGSKELIAKRMQERTGHFMPPELLDSQFATLEIPTSAIHISIDQAVDQIVDQILITLN